MYVPLVALALDLALDRLLSLFVVTRIERSCANSMCYGYGSISPSACNTPSQERSLIAEGRKRKRGQGYKGFESATSRHQ